MPPSDEREAYANCFSLQSFKIARFWLSSCRDLLLLACCCLLSLRHTEKEISWHMQKHVQIQISEIYANIDMDAPTQVFARVCYRVCYSKYAQVA